MLYLIIVIVKFKMKNLTRIFKDLASDSKQKQYEIYTMDLLCPFCFLFIYCVWNIINVVILTTLLKVADIKTFYFFFIFQDASYFQFFTSNISCIKKWARSLITRQSFKTSIAVYQKQIINETKYSQIIWSKWI